MASQYVTQAEAPNRSETNKYLDASGHWTVPSGGGGDSDYFTVVDGKLCIKYEEVTSNGNNN